MLLPKLPRIFSYVLVGSLLAATSAGCQRSAQNSPPPDSTATAPTEPTPTAPAQPAPTPSTPAPTAPTPPPTPTPTPAAPVAPPATQPTPQPAPIAEQSCSASAFVADTDPAGLNVRGGPGSDFPVIDNLPTNGPVEVTIAAGANGWLKLNTAWSMERQELEQPGWVYAPLLGVTTKSGDPNKPDGPVSLYSAPDGSSAVKTELSKAAEVVLLSCSGNWLEVQAPEATGWLAVGDQCSSPVAPCP
jgi:SH3-like domain-containing protein